MPSPARIADMEIVGKRYGWISALKGCICEKSNNSFKRTEFGGIRKFQDFLSN